MKTAIKRLLQMLKTFYTGYMGETQRIALRAKLKASKCKVRVVIDELGVLYHGARKIPSGCFIEKGHPSWAYVNRIRDGLIADFEAVGGIENFMLFREEIEGFRV